MDDLNIIDRFTETFGRYIDSGFGLLAGDVAFLTTIMVALDIVLAGLFWALHGEDNVPAQLIKKVLYVGFFALLLNNFQSLADVVFRSFAGLGLKASATSLTAQDLMRPGFVAEAGFTASQPLLAKAGELIGFTTFFENFVTIVVLLVAWLIVMLAFFVLAVQLFITILEFKLTTLAGFILVPFALFGHTAFLAERVLGNVISSGIKLMVLSIIVGIGATIFGSIVPAPGTAITLKHASSIILAAIAVFGLAIFIPAVAAGLVMGAPQLGAGAIVGTGAGLAASGVLTVGGARMVGHAAGTAVRSAATLTGTVAASYQGGGIAGVARATVAEPAARAMGSVTNPVRDAYREGAAAGVRATAAPSSDGSNIPPPSPSSGSQAPPWATALARRQTMRNASFAAAQTLREGDRPATGAGPDLKSKS
ncbi:P-type conjugative transfer protein TrbL [Hyphomicrobium sp. CS1BSMeth3]|uniref:P-type conjugative transfer protein TrbL n=1 Tax=Hyphomicrobium sp. CS1BSMeth3 TaxID=1892844 RepID=UPI00092FF548|nr:P-type conjugative transfer protein TrbL [Hyphomicrobium sp. CS1BSMeth3]